MHKNKLIASLLLALSACFAQADPVQFDFGPTAVAANDGSSPLAAYSFTVASNASYGGLLTTSTASSVADEFSQLSLVLSGNGTSYTIAGPGLALTSSATSQAAGMFGPYTVYTRTYTFDSSVLDAGDWTATLWGLDIDGAKSADTVALTLTDPPTDIPEPQSLALAAVALAALGVASRRRTSR